MHSSRKSPTLLITGGTGYLGSQLIRLAVDWDTHATFHTTPPSGSPPGWYDYCDLRNFDQVNRLLSSLRPDAIIHTAGSNQTALNLSSIVPAARNLSTLAQRHHIRLIHVSSDMVFNGNHAPYSEDDSPSPLTPYGRLKAEAEQVVLKHHPEALIVRTSLIYGMNPMDHQSKWLLETINREDPVRLFIDETRCPIWVKTLGMALLELTHMPERGILHVAGPEPLTRWDFGLAILTLFRNTRTSFLTAASVEDSDMIRPKNLALNVTKAQNRLRTPLFTIEEVTARLHSMDNIHG